MRYDLVRTSPRWTRRALIKGCAAFVAIPPVVTRPAAANELRLGVAAPQAMLQTLDGRRISTTDLVGEVVVLAFWATWCGPCRRELPLLSAYTARYAGAGLRVLGFSLDTAETEQEARQLAATLSFPTGLLSQSSAAGYGRIWRLPVSFTIDRAGRLAHDGWKEKHPGWTDERLAEIVSPLIRSAS
jgi:cytochrome c biogenesis protein CcmG, thiol:disulfide interchange protein DsbE